eukprot:1417455-Karenia_brevis.AAC.1
MMGSIMVSLAPWGKSSKGTGRPCGCKRTHHSKCRCANECKAFKPRKWRMTQLRKKKWRWHYMCSRRPQLLELIYSPLVTSEGCPKKP